MTGLAETTFRHGEQDNIRVPKLKRLLDHLIATEVITTSEAVAALAELVLAGNAGKVVTINAGGDGFDLVAPGFLTDGDKGDIVVSASGATWSFDSGVVTAFARTFLDDANAGAVRATIGAEATITAGTTAQYWRGDKSWQTLNAAALSDFSAAADARIAAAVGVSVQAYDADLVTISGLTATTDNVLQSVAGAWASRTPAQLKTTLVLVKADVGLGNVDNTSNATERAATATLTGKTVALGSNTVTGTLAEFNAALTGADFATGGGTAIGTNTGDQTSIVGITGTKAQFNTACTDGDFLFVGDITQYTDEAAQDAIGAMVDASLTYVDATPLLQRAALTGDATAAAGSNALTVVKINGVSLAGLATGILKNTTGTGAPSIAVAGDFPTLNQDTTGSAATLTTSRNFSISGGGITAAAVAFNGSAAVALSASVDAKHITLARMDDVATATVFYRKTAGTGTPEVQTLATLKTDLGLTGTNSGDQTITLTGDATGSGTGSFAVTVGKINGVSLAGLATGILKNTTTTGVPSIAVAGDFPTLNQNTTGSAATLTTSRSIYGGSFNGSADVTGIIASTYGGTGNGFTKFTGPATSERTFTLPNLDATLLYSGGPLGTPSSATLTNATGLPISTGVSGLAAGVAAFLATPSSANLITAVTDETGSGALVFGTSPTLATPVLNGLPTGTGVAATSTASTLVARDANKNVLANNYLADYTTTATAAGTTTITVASTYLQYFTGTTTQTITLPVASTMALGQQFQIVNNSTGALTVNSSGGNLVLTVAGGTAATITCILTSGTSAASWSASYWADVIASGKKLTVSNTLTFTGTDGSSVAFGTGGTVLYNGGALGTPSSGTLTSCTGLPVGTGISGLGTGVATALAVNVGSAGAFVTFNGAGGTPSSLTLNNATGLPIAGLVASTITAIGVGSIELGHASDTTISRASAGDIAVEGNTVYRVGGTDVSVADGGTGRSTSTTAYGLIAAGTTATGAHQTLAAGATTEILVGGGASALPVWTAATGSGSPVRATSPTLVTPVLGVATATSLVATNGQNAVAFSGTVHVALEADTNAGYVQSYAGKPLRINWQGNDVYIYGSRLVVTSATISTSIPVDVTGEMRCDTLRIDATATAGVVAGTHTIPISVNGTAARMIVAIP